MNLSNKPCKKHYKRNVQILALIGLSVCMVVIALYSPIVIVGLGEVLKCYYIISSMVKIKNSLPSSKGKHL